MVRVSPLTAEFPEINSHKRPSIRQRPAPGGSSATRTMLAPIGAPGHDFPERGRCVSLAPEEYVCEFLKPVTKRLLRNSLSDAVPLNDLRGSE